MTSHGAEENHPNRIFIQDENEARHLTNELGNVRLGSHPCTTSRYTEVAGVLVESSTNTSETSTSLKRKRTKSKESSDLVCPSLGTRCLLPVAD